MKQDGIWGDNLELFVAAKLLSFNFIVYESKSINILYQCELSSKYTTIYLEYENGNHFNILISKAIKINFRDDSTPRSTRSTSQNLFQCYMNKVQKGDKIMERDHKNMLKGLEKEYKFRLSKKEINDQDSFSLSNESNSLYKSDSDHDSDFYSFSSIISDNKEIIHESNNDQNELEREFEEIEFEASMNKSITVRKVLYMKAKGNNDTYNEVYRFLMYNKIPERFQNDSKGLKNWKKGVKESYYLSDRPLSRNGQSRLIFKSSKSGEVTVPFHKEVENLIKLAHRDSCEEVIIKHNGINTVIADLKDKKIYWASLSDDIREYIEGCIQCNEEMIVESIKVPKVITSNGPLYRIVGDLWQIAKFRRQCQKLLQKKSYSVQIYFIMC